MKREGIDSVHRVIDIIFKTRLCHIGGIIPNGWSLLKKTVLTT